VKYRYFIDILSYIFPLFNDNLKTDNYMSKTERFIWQYDTSLHFITSLLVRNGSSGIT